METTCPIALRKLFNIIRYFLMYGDFDVRTSFIDAGGYLNNLQHIEWIDRLRA
jgi:hypothetical protein